MSQPSAPGDSNRASDERRRIPVLVDCDNTMGLPGNEIDDGLTLLMLLASDRVDVVGVTTTFGNGSEEAVFGQTTALLAAVGRSDIPVIRGANHAAHYDTQAASFIGEVARLHRGALAILAIGSLTNIAAALAGDPLLARNVSRICIMGGYLGPLRFLRREVAELNLSCDSAAAASVFQSDLPVTLMSAQLCLQARYGFRHLIVDLIRTPRLAPHIVDWFVTFSSRFGTLGFYLWDLVPAWALLEPGRFGGRRVRVACTQADLLRGVLRISPAGKVSEAAPGVINLPGRIRRRFGFAGDCARLWSQTRLRIPVGPPER